MKVQVLSPAPLNERAPSNGGFFVMGPSQGLEPAKERALRKRGAFLASWRGRRQAAEAGADPRSGYADVLSPAPLNERAPSNGSFFVMCPSQGLEPAKERALRKHGAFLASWRGRRQAAEAGADPRSGYADVLSPAPLNEELPAMGAFLFCAVTSDGYPSANVCLSEERPCCYPVSSPPLPVF